MSERIPGTPRTLQEMDFVAGTRACAKCGDRSDLKWSNVHSGTVWRTSAKCPSCGSERSYVFSSDEDLIELVPPELELGPGPSTVLDTATLRAEIERLGRIESTEFDWDRMERLQTALNEFAKLIKAGRAPGVYRASVDRQRAQLAQLVKARVAARKAEPESVTPRGSLDRHAQQAHWDWLQRGKTGAGRLDVVGLTATKGRYDGFKAAGARFERVDFRDSNFNLADWTEVELVGCNLNTSAINSTRFVQARILGSTFEGCGGALVNFERANIGGSSFARSNFDGARFEGATVASTSFEGVQFGNVHWDRATFQGCSLRGASLEPTRQQPTSTMRGARFAQCDFRDVDFTGADLRGATFSDCRFAGAHGMPKHTTGVTITGANTTELLAQLTRVWGADEVLAHDKPVVAEDRMPGASLLAVFELVGKKARLIGKTAAAGADAFRSAGIPVGATYGTSGFVWAHTPESFRVWSSEGMPLEVTRQELLMSGVPSPVANVKSVALLSDSERRGRRGVIVRTPDARPVRLVVVQEDDWVASEDASYSDADVRRDAGWARLLAADLASWFGVPFDE